MDREATGPMAAGYAFDSIFPPRGRTESTPAMIVLGGDIDQDGPAESQGGQRDAKPYNGSILQLLRSK